MSFENPQPGDHTPHDAATAEDQRKLREGGGSNTRAGDHASHDHPQPGDQKKKDQPLSANVNAVHFSAPFIKRPVATFLLSAAIILGGSVAYKLLPVASLPQVEYPVINVGASLPGGDPETMASAVATPLERQFSRIAGINEMTSSSSIGSSRITMQFDLDRDVNGAARDVQAAINAARAQLPANLPSNPTYRKSNPADAPILMLGLTSDTVSVAQMYDVSDSILAQKISQVEGVGQTFTGGSAKPAVRIETNPNQLANSGLGLEAVRAAIGTVNVLQPTGYLNGDGPNGQHISIDTTDQLFGAAAYAPLIIATNKGPVSSSQASANGAIGAGSGALNATSSSSTSATTGGTRTSATNSAATTAASTPATVKTTVKPTNVTGIVRLQDVAHVFDGVEDIHTGGVANGVPAIIIQVFKSPGANVIQTVDNVLKILPQLQASIPPAIKLQVLLDRTTTIRASVKDVTHMLLLSVSLVIMVVFLFLREGRSTLIPSVSVPLSLLGTCGAMYLMGFTIDNLSLMALTISTGFVVDDAIVVIENISRHLEKGMTPFQAAMKGSAEIGFTVLSMSISLIAVFIPILLMGGIVGRLFREFALTLSAAIFMSLIVSLTTTPMLAAKFLRPVDHSTKGWFYRTGARHLQRLSENYGSGLSWVLRHQFIIGLVFLCTFGLNIYFYFLVPKGFFPQQDTGRMNGNIRGQQDVSFDVMKQKMLQLNAIVSKDPAVLNTVSFVGGGGGGSSNSGQMFIVLQPDEQRHPGLLTNIRNYFSKNPPLDMSSEATLNRLRPLTGRIPGVQLLLQSSQELNIGGRQSATQYQYALTADSLTLLNEWSVKLMAAMQDIPSLKDVTTNQQQEGLKAQLVIDRDTASRLGISAQVIDATLSDAFGQRQVATTYRPLNQYHVVMQVQQQYQNDPLDMQKIFLKANTGAMIPLSAITHYETKRVPLSIPHQGQTPATTLSFNLTLGSSLSDATVAIDEARVKIGMPSTVHGSFQGTAAAFQDSLSTMPLLVLLALVTVYIVLGILYESFVHPLTILSTLPSASVGAFLFLLLFKVDLSVMAMIGIVLLIGIVNKNAIMMVDFALVAEREEGMTPEQAIFHAAMLRFRPIMMTTMAALLGGLPMALGSGTGSELRRPLGITIVGGLCVSQCLTLFTTPVVYLFFDRVRVALPAFRRRLRRWMGFAVKPQGGSTPAHVAGD